MHYLFNKYHYLEKMVLYKSDRVLLYGVRKIKFGTIKVLPTVLWLFDSVLLSAPQQWTLVQRQNTLYLTVCLPWGRKFKPGVWKVGIELMLCTVTANFGFVDSGNFDVKDAPCTGQLAIG